MRLQRAFFRHAACILATRASLLAGRSIVEEWPRYDEFGCVTGLADNYGAIRRLTREFR